MQVRTYFDGEASLPRFGSNASPLCGRNEEFWVSSSSSPSLSRTHGSYSGVINDEKYTKTGQRRVAQEIPHLIQTQLISQVHFDFLRHLRDKQLKFRILEEPLDTLADVLVDQFSGEQWQLMIRLYGLLCSSLEKSFETFKTMKQKDQKFAALVSSWSKEVCA
jgi:hypothetical protein